MGQRRAPGEIQLAIAKIVQHQYKLEKALSEYNNLLVDVDATLAELEAQYDVGRDQIMLLNRQKGTIEDFNITIGVLSGAKTTLQSLANATETIAGAAADGIPTAPTDFLAPARGMVKNGYSSIDGAASSENEKLVQMKQLMT